MESCGLAGTEVEEMNVAGAENAGTHDASIVAPYNETFNSNTITISIFRIVKYSMMMESNHYQPFKMLVSSLTRLMKI